MTDHLIHYPMSRTLGWTLLHLLWQGALIGLMLAAMLAVLRRGTASARYAACCTALLALALCPCLTFALLARFEASALRPVMAAVTAPSAAGADIREQMRATSLLAVPDGIVSLGDRLLPALTLCWCVGVALMSLRLLGGWIHVRRLAWDAARPITGELQAQCAVLARRMGIVRAVELLESTLTEVPCTFGWLRVVVLLPASAVSGLSPAALEALLAHELAHVRRCDYLVNLLQTALEALLFYHPVTWWISQQIRQEREHCCDDLAVAVLGDARGYARALAALETCRQALPTPALGATDGELLPRIRRVLGMPAPPPRPTPTGAAAVILLALFGCGALALTVPAAYRQGTAVARRADRSVRRTFAAKLDDLFGDDLFGLERMPTVHAASVRSVAPARGRQRPDNVRAASHRALITAGRHIDRPSPSTGVTAPRRRAAAARPTLPGAYAAMRLQPPSHRIALNAPAPAPEPPHLLLARELPATVQSALGEARNHISLASRGDGASAVLVVPDRANAKALSDLDGDIEVATAAAEEHEERAIEAQGDENADAAVARAMKESDRAIATAMRNVGAELDHALAEMPKQLRQARLVLKRAQEQVNHAQRQHSQALKTTDHRTGS